MCYKVECRDCGKTTWGGCGKHLKTLYPTIPQGQHCTCRSWPGVVIPTASASATSTSTAAAEDTTGSWCSIM